MLFLQSAVRSSGSSSGVGAVSLAERRSISSSSSSSSRQTNGRGIATTRRKKTSSLILYSSFFPRGEDIFCSASSLRGEQLQQRMEAQEARRQPRREVEKPRQKAAAERQPLRWTERPRGRKRTEPCRGPSSQTKAAAAAARRGQRRESRATRAARRLEAQPQKHKPRCLREPTARERPTEARAGRRQTEPRDLEGQSSALRTGTESACRQRPRRPPSCWPATHGRAATADQAPWACAGGGQRLFVSGGAAAIRGRHA